MKNYYYSQPLASDFHDRYATMKLTDGREIHCRINASSGRHAFNILLKRTGEMGLTHVSASSAGWIAEYAIPGGSLAALPTLAEALAAL